MVDLSQLGQAAGAVAVLLILIKYISNKDKQQSVRDEQFALALGDVSDSMNKVAVATEKSAKATQKSAKEAAQRNGHLAELAIENQTATLAAIAAIKNPQINEQRVKHQTVEAQTNLTEEK